MRQILIKTRLRRRRHLLHGSHFGNIFQAFTVASRVEGEQEDQCTTMQRAHLGIIKILDSKGPIESTNGHDSKKTTHQTHHESLKTD